MTTLIDLVRLRVTWRSFHRWRRGIGPRLLVRVLLFSSAITLLLTSFQLYFEYRYAVRAIESRMSEIEGSYLQSLGGSLWNLDSRQIELQIEGILRLPAMRFVEVRETTDRANPLVVSRGHRQEHAALRRVFSLVHTSRGDQEQLGVLSIEATFDEVYRTLLQRAIIILIREGTEIFLVSFFILSLTHRLVTRHLTALAGFLGTYDLRQPPPPLRLQRRAPKDKDELDHVLAAFERMRQSLERAYEALQKREAEIRRLVEANIIGIVVWNLEGRIIEANEAFLRIVNYSRGDLVSGRVSWREITPDKWRAADEQALTELAATGSCEPFEKEYFRKDGSCVSVLVGAAFFEGRRDEGVAFVLDLTERKHAEEELRRSALELQRSESYLAEGQRLAHLGSWAFDHAGFDYWSPELFRIYGLDPAGKAPTVQEYLDCVHPQDRESMANLIKGILDEPSCFDATKRIVRPDGEVRYIRCVGAPVVENQRLKKYVGSAIDVTEQELLTQELHSREAYLTEAQRLSHTGSFGWKPDTGEVIWSAETYRIFEYDRAVTPTIDLVAQRVHPEDRADFHSVIERASAGASDFEHAYRLLLPDGRAKHVHALAHATQDASGNREFVGAVTDITNQRQAEESLRKSEAYLTDAQKVSQTGSWAWSPEGGIKYWSEECYRVQGFDPRDGLPRFEELFQRIHPDDQPKLKELMQRVAREKIEFETDYRLVHPDGAVRDIHSTAHPVFSPTGDLIEFMGTVIDVTDRKRAEEELRQSEAYLAEAQKLSQTGSWAWSPDQDIRYWSEECYRVLSFDPQHGLPRFEEFIQRIHPDDQPGFRELIQTAIRDKAEWEADYRIVHPGGAVRDIHVVGHPVLSTSGHLVEFVGTVIDITERKRAEEELRRSEAYLAEAQRLSHTGSWAWSPDTDVRYWSEECYRVLGFDPRDGLPRFEEFIQRIHPDDQPAFRESAKRAKHKKLDEDVHYRIVHPGGAVRDIHSIGHPVFSPSGDLIEFTGTVIDITERKRAEEELRASERKYRHLVDTTPAFVHTALPNGDLDFFNRGWLEYLGLSITDLLGWRWTSVIHPEDVEGLVAKWRAALESGEAFVAEARVRRADGKYRWFLHRKQPQRNEAGEIVKWYGSSIEIEERKIAEEAIRRGEAFLAEGQRLSHTGNWGWNASTGKMTWSQEHFRILGLDPQATNPSLDVFWERVHPDDRIGLQRTFESAIRDKRDFEQEFRIVRSDSSIRHLHDVGHAVLNKANELVEFMGTTMDITERKRAEAALQEARAELERVTRVTTMGELAASIAHEVNQPLAGVVTSANAGLNWLAANPPNLSKTREALERILRDGTRAGEVLTRIRALLKRTAPAKSPVSVNQVIRDVVGLTGGELRQKNVELSLELASTLPEILGDEIQLQQVFLNLIKNAIEAMENIADRRKVLLIRSELGELEGKPAISLQISDTGVGFDSANTDGLFQAFYTTKPEGMGMGLWISRSIVEAHGGRLSVLNNDGSGATFQIVFPVEGDWVAESTGSAEISHTKV